MQSNRWLLSLFGVAALVTVARADVVQDWRNAANYPARVTAVIWGNTRLDANHSVRFGSWTVRFAAPTYVAAYIILPQPDTPVRLIKIGNEIADQSPRCSNAVAGERSCFFQFLLSPLQGCEIDTYMGSGVGHTSNSSGFAIPCPTALDLQQ
ncbi:MAG: hypothetical protein KGJ66_03105 [Alphaproteobacteria bacterium]|nr:hypothetical protein [Alphaproteobacteria bacterium]